MPAIKNILRLLPISSIGAVMYAIPVYYFIQLSDFKNSWMLYLGNGLFMAFIFLSTLFFIRSSKKVMNVIIMGHAISVIAIIVSCLLIIMLLMIQSPAIFHLGGTEKVLADTPSGSKGHFVSEVTFRV